ncbi:MAG: hypothetical protein IKO56_00240 [Alphaproteobacteria bacterium]|nr:hypothetical protein [Alphaproteobacteria bacterium]
MSNRVVKSPVIVDKKGKPNYPEIERIPSEKWLQDFLPLCPDVLPVADIDSNYADLTYVCNEASIKTSKKGTGHVDVIFISKSGRLVLVETKLHRNPESCREVLGQILDYAANIRASDWDYSTLNDLYGKNDLYSDMQKKFKDLPDEDTFIQNVNRYIKQAEFLMMIVGDTIRPTVENIAAFVNSPIDMKYKLTLCEIKTYKMGDKYLVIPQLTTDTIHIERAVITIQNNNIVCSTKNQLEESHTKQSADYITEEKFVSDFVSKNSNISETAVYDFLNALRDAGYVVSTRTKHVTIGILNVISLFEISENRMWFTPSRINSWLKGTNKSAKFQYFMEAMKPYVTTNHKALDKFYIVNSNVMTTARKSFIETLKKVKDVIVG